MSISYTQSDFVVYSGVSHSRGYDDPRRLVYDGNDHIDGRIWGSTSSVA